MRKLLKTFIRFRIAVIIVFNKLMFLLSRMVPRKTMTVIIEQGTLLGQHYKTQLSNKLYVSFLGVPYAKPPIDDLRFKSPVKHPGWSGTFKAFSEGNMCVQFDSFMTKKIVGSEDCLYLNIFVPQEKSNEKKAVMVFIHGGAFIQGSGSLDIYSPDYLLDENVIVVTINYRLNVLGFLNFDIDECSGNMGLKDQLFALKWVKSNISAFGGNADNINIFGESAGAASVHYHILSPRSTGFFQKAIMQSGNAFNPWAFNDKHREAAYNLAKQLGCQKENPKEIIQYLQKVPATDLVKCTTEKIKFEGQRELFNFQFVPSIESDAVSDQFLPADRETLAKAASPVPIITGINDMEGLISFSEHKLENLYNFQKPEEIRKLFESYYSDEIINQVKNFYFNGQNLKNDTAKLENLCHMFSDVFFKKDFHYCNEYFLEKAVTTPVYNYEFKFDGEINAFKKLLFATRPIINSIKGACHADELNYMFYARLFGFLPKANSPEYRMCRTICKLWCNFAKTGDPNSSDLPITWNSSSADDPKYLSLDGDSTHMVDDFINSSRKTFWENISKIIRLKQKL